MTCPEHRACWLMVVVIAGCFCSRIRIAVPWGGGRILQVPAEPQVIGVMAM